MTRRGFLSTAVEARHQLTHSLPYLSVVNIHMIRRSCPRSRARRITQILASLIYTAQFDEARGRVAKLSHGCYDPLTGTTAPPFSLG